MLVCCAVSSIFKVVFSQVNDGTFFHGCCPLLLGRRMSRSFHILCIGLLCDRSTGAKRRTCCGMIGCCNASCVWVHLVAGPDNGDCNTRARDCCGCRRCFYHVLCKL